MLDFATRKIVTTWPIPGGGSPDMGNVSADGKTLWLSGRYDNVVYAIDTATGEVDEHPGRQGAPRPHRLAPARPLLARPHRQHALPYFGRTRLLPTEPAPVTPERPAPGQLARRWNSGTTSAAS